MTMMPLPAEPTFEQCQDLADLGHGWTAMWYPQMGGYASKCAVFAGGPGSCFEALIWHDGEFPFEGKPPIELHHCDTQQFRRFAEEVEALQQRVGNADAGQVSR